MLLGLPFSAYSALMAASALVSLLFAARALFGTRKNLARSFAFLEAAVFVWSLFRLLQWEVPSRAGQFEALKLQYLGIAFIPSAFFLMALALANRPAKALTASLCLLPGFAFIALIATNGLHRLFWTGDMLSALPENPPGGPAFWAFIAYGYLVVLVSLAIIARIAFGTRGMFGRFLRRLLLLCLLPLFANAAYVFAFLGRTGYDPTPAVFAVMGLFIAFGMRNFDLLETVPYAKGVILESIDTPLLVVDSEGLVAGSNEEARRIAPGLPSLEGRPVSEIVPALGGREGDRESRKWSFAGIDYLITCYDVKRGSSRRRGRIYVFRDISSLEKAAREVEEAREKADAANAAKSAFVAAVSHELRNPLNAIIGLTDLDLRASPPPELRADLEIVLSSANVLLGLVNDLLDLSKIEAGRMELESVDFDLHEKAVSMLRGFRPAVEKKGIFLDIVVEEGTPRYVRGDPLRYGQVLMNLVSNAVKFTDRGAVAVRLSPLPVAEGGRPLGVLTSVRDSGMGIAADQLPRLFRDFSQADPSVARRFGGTGLGLSISKRLVELFGGEIEVKSEVGEGSVFSFTARFEPGDAAKAAPEPRPELSGTGSLRVLVVDDDPVNSAVATRFLERLGHEAAQAGSGAEAIAMVKERAFDLVLLDLGLPDMDGFEACRRIRFETPAGRSGALPIAAMTARGDNGLRGECASAGMIDCISKPLNHVLLDSLLERVAATAHELGPRAAASVRTPGLLETAPAAPRPAEPGTPLVDEAALLERLEGEDSFMLRLLSIFAAEAPARRKAYREAISAGDLEAIQRLCHGLKGSSLSLCALPLGAAAGALEVACIAARKGGSSPEAIGEIAKGAEALGSLLSDTAAAARAIAERGSAR
jgi:signal transduction histidine kinase/DNA-binding response OmpR family regulator